MDKSPGAFRTISEVAEALDTAAHVLRFWESRFPQIRPVKRAGGRRYYRPSDVALLAGIKRLLHEDGITIRGVQKVLREQGVRHVQSLARAMTPEFGPVSEVAELEAAMAMEFFAEVEPELAQQPETGQVVSLKPVRRLAPSRPEPGEPANSPEPVAARPSAETVSDGEPAAQPRPIVPRRRVTRGQHAAPTGPELPLTPAATDPSESAEPELALLPPAPQDSQTDAAIAAVMKAALPQAGNLPPDAAPLPPLSLAPHRLAARLRSLPRHPTPEARQALGELRMRLGLLHARMAEAQKPRR